MSNNLVTKFIEFNDLRVLTGEDGAMDLFYPFLLMDAAYQIFAADIKHIPCKTEMKRCRNRLSEAYNAYWKRFFTIYTLDEKDAIIDMMDEYTKFISMQIMQLRVASMNVIVKYVPDFKSQQILASCFVSSTLSHCANTVHEIIFKNSLREDKKDVNITAIERYTRDFCDWFIERNTDCRDYIPVGSDYMVGKVVDALVNKLARFPDLLTEKNNSGMAERRPQK